VQIILTVLVRKQSARRRPTDLAEDEDALAVLRQLLRAPQKLRVDLLDRLVGGRRVVAEE
jgi:hypothetical protein